MVDTTAFSGFALASFCISVSPGPSWLFVISSTLSQGRRFGYLAVVGNGSGIVCHVLATAFGLAQLIQTSPTAFAAMKITGACYLACLGLRLLQRRSVLSSEKLTRTNRSALKTWRDGCLVNLLNPKVPVLMLALMPQFVRPENGHIQAQMLLLGCVHLIVASSVLSTLVVVCAMSVTKILDSAGQLRTLQMIMGLVMIALSCSLVGYSAPTSNAIPDATQATTAGTPR